MSSFLEWKLAFRNLFRNRRRSLSTVFGIVVAFVGLSLLSGHIIKSEKSMSTMIIYHHHLGHISIYKKGGVENIDIHPDQYRISDSELVQIQSILKSFPDEIEMTGSFLSTPGILSNGKVSYPAWVFGIEPDLDDFIRNHPNVKQWTPEMTGEFSGQSLNEGLQSIPDAVSVGRGLYELLSNENTGEVSTEFSLGARTWEGNFNAVSATAVGKHSTGLPLLDDVSVVAPTKMVKDLLQADGVSYLLIYLKDPSHLKSFLKRLTAKIEEQKLDVEAVPFKDERIGSVYLGTMGFLFSMAFIFGTLTLSTVILVILHSMKLNVIDRAKEIGILKSLGYTPRKVRGLFVKEAIWLALLACALGCVVTKVISILVNLSGLTYESPGINVRLNFGIVLPPTFYAGLSLLIIVVSVGAAYWAAASLAKAKITKLLVESEA